MTIIPTPSTSANQSYVDWEVDGFSKIEAGFLSTCGISYAVATEQPQAPTPSPRPADTSDQPDTSNFLLIPGQDMLAITNTQTSDTPDNIPTPQPITSVVDGADRDSDPAASIEASNKLNFVVAISIVGFSLLTLLIAFFARKRKET